MGLGLGVDGFHRVATLNSNGYHGRNGHDRHNDGADDHHSADHDDGADDHGCPTRPDLGDRPAGRARNLFTACRFRLCSLEH